MSQIHVLPDNLVNQIAAGEVVERPSSVVKELIENSIDADASTITVEVEAGGKKLIKVTDNGKGISKDDLPLAFERHATSKISTQDDLSKISTMGFRGEAIASIGSVSEMWIASHPRMENSDLNSSETTLGHLLSCKGGDLTDIEPHGMPEGTQVFVRNIFYNTPARLKFMKTDQTEFNYISNYVTEVALIHPTLHIKLIHNGRLIADYTPASDSLERIRQVFGDTVAREVLPAHFLSSELKLSGFIGKPGIARRNRQSQYLFVNNRPVKNTAVSAAVGKAFLSLLPHGKYPFFVLNIDLLLSKVDVNVHPRKLEVRFLYQSEIFQVVTSAVKKVLEKEILSPEITGEARSYWKTEKMYSPPKLTPEKVNQAMKFTEDMLAPAPRAHQPIAEPIQTTQSHAPHEQELSISPICQIANSYILALGEEGLIIIDQHAAHERILYNKFIAQVETSEEFETQRLLVPIQIDLTITEAELLKQNSADLKSIGFEIEPFGGNTFQVHAVPTAFTKADIQKIVLEVIDDLKTGDPKRIKDKQHEAICYMACRGAIKFGDKLTHEEMVALIRQMDEQDQISTCPHGRPTTLRLTFSELEKRFGRI
ncbi:DNA mismatch repair endonuclease MutL [Candidatus Peregrinibacteria bacterium]|nr:DNA mismatch repair endonuclease MutL [Candidatus Peregrinibacteria bacterium]